MKLEKRRYLPHHWLDKGVMDTLLVFVVFALFYIYSNFFNILGIGMTSGLENKTKILTLRV